jgi:hypothetical protein
MWQSRSNAIVPLILALAGFGCGSEETRPAAPPAAAPAPAAPRDAAAPAPAAGAAVPAPPQGAVEWKGDLPSDFPDDVPQYPDSKVTATEAINDQLVSVTFDSPETVEIVAKFYADSLAATGWTTQTQQTAEGTMILADKEDRMLQALIYAGGRGALVDVVTGQAQ